MWARSLAGWKLVTTHIYPQLYARLWIYAQIRLSLDCCTKMVNAHILYGDIGLGAYRPRGIVYSQGNISIDILYILQPASKNVYVLFNNLFNLI